MRADFFLLVYRKQVRLKAIMMYVLIVGLVVRSRSYSGFYR